jgi:hypothetical protein
MPDADSSDNAVVDAVGGSEASGRQAAYTPEEVQALRITRVNVQEDVLYCVLSDGKLLSVPVGVSLALAAAPMRARYQWRISGDGRAIVWYGDELKEYLSLRSLLAAEIAAGGLSEFQSEAKPNPGR